MKNRIVTFEDLRNWERSDTDICDDLMRYFGDTYTEWDWCAVADEATRVWNAMFDDDIERLSPMDGVFSAIAAHAHRSTVESFAAMFGVDVEKLALLHATWYERQDRLPSPIDPCMLRDYLEMERSSEEQIVIFYEMYMGGYPDMIPGRGPGCFW